MLRYMLCLHLCIVLWLWFLTGPSLQNARDARNRDSEWNPDSYLNRNQLWTLKLMEPPKPSEGLFLPLLVCKFSSVNVSVVLNIPVASVSAIFWVWIVPQDSLHLPVESAKQGKERDAKLNNIKALLCCNIRYRCNVVSQFAVGSVSTLV